MQLIVEPVETVMFDVFDQTHGPQWRSLRARFFADNEEVKAATKELIDTSFRKLRSAEGAFDLLQVCCWQWTVTQHSRLKQHSNAQSAKLRSAAAPNLRHAEQCKTVCMVCRQSTGPQLAH